MAPGRDDGAGMQPRPARPPAVQGPRLRGCRLLAFGLALAGCSITPAPRHPRPALPLPPEVARSFALPGPVATESFACTRSGREVREWRGTLRCGSEAASFNLLQPRDRGPVPLVVCLPILAGGADLMRLVAEGMAARGMAAAWADRPGPALRGPQTGRDLDALFRKAVAHNRMLLRWAERRSDLFVAGRVAVLGISTGGIVGAVLLAVEPGFAAGALCLAGADLASLLRVSEEPRVMSWRQRRAATDGIGGRLLERELARDLTADPAHLGAYVATDRVLLVHAGLDRVVPDRQHRLLWESLGRPRDLRLACLGHYSAALALGAVLEEVARFFRARFAGAPS
jgi:dienelactone hydrolase